MSDFGLSGVSAKTAARSEAALALEIGASLTVEGWDVYNEVKLSDFLKNMPCPTGVADLVAIKGALAMVVEVKKSFSLELLEQTLEWTRIFPLVSMAVPVTNLKNRSVLKDHLRDYYGLGLYGVGRGHVNYHKSPRLLRHNLRMVDAIKGALHPNMKLSVAGSAVTYRHSPYQDLTWYIRTILAAFGPMTPKDLFTRLESEKGSFHYSTRTGMRQQAMMAIRTYEADLSIRDDGNVHWDPALQINGADYTARVQDVGQFRRTRTALVDCSPG